MSEEIQWVIRLDAAIQFGNFEITEEGYLRIHGTAAATGPMSYKQLDGGERIEMVDEETLRDSAALLKNKPLTLEHPPTGLLGPETIKEYQVGEVLESEYNPDSKQVDVLVEVRDQKAIDAVLDRKATGLSPGYKLFREPAPEGAGYHYVQRDRRYNHLALTATPRRGERTSLRMDSAGNIIQTDSENPMEDEDKNADGLSARVDAMEEKMDSVLAAVDSLTTAIDAMKPDENDDADDADNAEEAAEANDSDDFLERYKAHRRAVEVAERLDVEFDENADSTDDIRRAVAAAQVSDEVSLDSAKEGYIDALFEIAARKADEAAAPAAEESLDSLAAAFKLGVRKDSLSNDSADDEIPVVDPTRLAAGRKSKSNRNED